ncbi:MAG: ferritin, partial [Planctomycetota bacterium]
MLKPEIERALNEQFNYEQTASQEYLAMAAYFEQVNLGGFARFMMRQSEEEREHAMKIFSHIFDRGGRVRLGPIPEPRADFDSPQAVFAAAYAREKANTKSIHGVYKLASDEGDYATQTMLHWFIDEQVEEEKWCEEATTLLEMVGDNRGALLMLDGRYG